MRRAYLLWPCVALLLLAGGIYQYRVQTQRAAAAAGHAAAVKELRDSVLRLKIALEQGLTRSELASLSQDVSFNFAKNETELPRSKTQVAQIRLLVEATEYFWAHPYTVRSDLPELYQFHAMVLGEEPVRGPLETGETTAGWTPPKHYRSLGFAKTRAACDALLQELKPD